MRSKFFVSSFLLVVLLVLQLPVTVHLRTLLSWQEQRREPFTFVPSHVNNGENRSPIEIKALNVPERLENGTRDSIVLDCEYSFDERKDKMLVVKWFLNDDTTPIYQWIAELGTQSIAPRLMGRIETSSYNIPNSSTYTRHSTIKLVNPTIELSGKYTCNVQSIRGEQSRSKMMIIYAPPKNVSFTVERLTNRRTGSNSRNPKQPVTNREMMALATDSKQTAKDNAPGAVLRCNVENVYPKPDVSLHGIRKDGSRYSLSEATKQEKYHPQSRAHSVYLSAHVSDADVLKRFNEDGLRMHDADGDSDTDITGDREGDRLFRHPYHYNQERQEVRQREGRQQPQVSGRHSFQFECISSLDFASGTGNLTRAVSLTYTPNAETKNFFRSSSTPLLPSQTSGLFSLLLLLWFFFLVSS